MKTVIIKTEFWDDESFEALHLDSKLLYFYLLANPSRTLHSITKINLKVAAVHTGLSIEHVNKSISQLEQVGLIVYKDRYYKLLKDFVEAKKGRYTAQAVEKEEDRIPDEIIEFFNNSTGIAPVHKDKDINKDIDKNNDIVITGAWEGEPDSSPDPKFPPPTANAQVVSITKPRKRTLDNDLWDALCEAFDYEPTDITKPLRGKLNAAIKELKAVKATPQEVLVRAANYRKLHPDWEQTPNALVNHWAGLRNQHVNQIVTRATRDRVVSQFEKNNTLDESIRIAALRSQSEASQKMIEG